MKRPTRITAHRVLVWTLALVVLLLFGNLGRKYVRYHVHLYKNFHMMKDFYELEGGFLQFKLHHDRARKHSVAGMRRLKTESLVNRYRTLRSRMGMRAPMATEDFYHRLFVMPEIAGHEYGFLDDPPAEKKVADVRILCVGPSTTERGYPEPLSDMLRRKHPGQYEVINAGISGSVVLNTFMNYSLTWRRFEPDYVFIEHNVNDAAMNYVPFDVALQREPDAVLTERKGAALEAPVEDGLDRFRTLLESTVMMVRASGARPVLLTYQTALSTEDMKGSFSGDFRAEIIAFYMGLYPTYTVQGALQTIERQNEIIREVATRMECDLIDTVGSIPSEDANFFDANHHSESGNAIVAELVMEWLLDDRAKQQGPGQEEQGTGAAEGAEDP